MFNRVFFPVIIVLFLFAGNAHSGGSCAMASRGIKANNAINFVLIQCTADASDGSMSAALNTETMNALSGRLIYNVTAYPGGTAPTDESDLAIVDSRGKSLMTAAGNGLNFIDSTTLTEKYTENAEGNDHYQSVHKGFPLTFTITGNSVNSAIMNISLDVSSKIKEAL